MGYGVLLLGTLLLMLPHRRRFLTSERWGGYAQSEKSVDIVQNPLVSPILLTLWISVAALITIGWWSVWAALVNLVICRYFFVWMRWRGVLRGMGAPGFFVYWLGLAVFLLEFTSHYAPGLKSLALFVLQVEFALVILSAGMYKFTAGYTKNQGMELGMVNPLWGYWWSLYAKVSPVNWVFKTLNQLAWAVQVITAVMMLIPQTRLLGALLIMCSFVFIVTQIRLALLCWMVMLCGVLFFFPGSFADQFIGRIVSPASSSAPGIVFPASLITLLEVALWAYVVLLPIAHFGLFVSFYRRKSLPGVVQRSLDGYTNFFGIIIWRVFSVDVVNFFVRIHRQPRGSEGPRTLISDYGWGGGLRYRHVAESITITSVFTTLKYYPSNYERFRERLLRYAHTVPCPEDSILVFEYVSIVKSETSFDYIPAAEYTVDLVLGTVDEHILDEDISVRAAQEASPVHEGARPGSYAPLHG